MTDATISAPEAGRLRTLESVIERGIATFVEVGTALAEIRDSALYRETHRTFADYCQDRWRMSDRRARQLMDAADLSVQIGTMVPLSERAVRPLASLPDAALPCAVDDVKERVAAGVEPRTAVREAVREARGQPRNGYEPAPSAEPDESQAVDPVAEWERAERECEDLRGQVAALSASDLGREVVAWQAKYAQLNGRLDLALQQKSDAERSAKFQAEILGKVRRLLRVEANGEIVAAVTDLLR